MVIQVFNDWLTDCNCKRHWRILNLRSTERTRVKQHLIRGPNPSAVCHWVWCIIQYNNNFWINCETSLMNRKWHKKTKTGIAGPNRCNKSNFLQFLFWCFQTWLLKWWWWWWWWWWNVFVVWLTDERRLALFPAGTIVRDPHHHESPTHRELDLNCVQPEFRLKWMKLCISDNHYTTAPKAWQKLLVLIISTLHKSMILIVSYLCTIL